MDKLMLIHHQRLCKLAKASSAFWMGNVNSSAMLPPSDTTAQINEPVDTFYKSATYR